MSKIREAALKNNLKEKKVKIKQWDNAEVLVKGLSFKEAGEFQSDMIKMHKEGKMDTEVTARWVMRKTFDPETKKLVFKDGDLEHIMNNLSGQGFGVVFDVITELSGGNETADDLVKN